MSAVPQTRDVETVSLWGQPAYMMESGDSPFYDAAGLGWSPTLRDSATETPDRARIWHEHKESFFYGEGSPEPFSRAKNAPFLADHKAETVHGGLVNENVAPPYRFAPRPIAPAPNRWTAYLMPRGYLFQRKFGSDARQLDGSHFSMADHRRKYAILGMEPVRNKRNTDRVSPQPHDAFSKDQAPDPIAQVRATAIREVFTPRNTYRLG